MLERPIRLADPLSPTRESLTYGSHSLPACGTNNRRLDKTGGNRGAAAACDIEVALGCQLIDGGRNGVARNIQMSGQDAPGGQSISLSQPPVGDGRPQLLVKLPCQRRGTLPIEID